MSRFIIGLLLCIIVLQFITYNYKRESFYNINPPQYPSKCFSCENQQTAKFRAGKSKCFDCERELGSAGNPTSCFSCNRDMCLQ